MMYHSNLACFRLLAIIGLLLILLVPQKPRVTYLGLDSSDWEGEIDQWRRGGLSCYVPGGSWMDWYRKTPLTRQWLERLGILSNRAREEMPLLEGDPAAVDVLIELLGSRNRDARQIAAQGLEMVGKDAQRADSALSRATNDSDREVRLYAKQARSRQRILHTRFSRD